MNKKELAMSLFVILIIAIVGFVLFATLKGAGFNDFGVWGLEVIAVLSALVLSVVFVGIQLARIANALEKSQ